MQFKSDRTQPSSEEVKSSVTALSVARGFARAVLTEYDYLFDVHEAELVNHLTEVGGNSISGMNWVLGKTLASLPYSMQQRFFNYAVVPGYDNVLMLRKFMIRQKMEEAIKSGKKRFVILGGGYDINGLVIALEDSDVRVYEIDRGPTRECKLQGLRNIPEGIGFEKVKFTAESADVSVVNHNMFYINADLGEEKLSTVLARVGYQSKEDTVFIAEGLSMYLTPEANRNLLNSVVELATPSSELIISYSTTSMYSNLSKMVQTSSNELYKFLLPMEDVMDFAAGSGLSVTERFSAAHALEDIGDSNVEHYKLNATKPLEMYYTMKNQAAILGVTIEHVPIIKLNLPEKPQDKVSAGYCSLQ